MTLREALLESNNAAAVLLQRQVGSRPVLQLAGDLGVTDQPDVPSLALGSGLVSPLDLTAAYAVFPTLGQRVMPRALVTVRMGNGEVVHEVDVRRERILPEPVAYQMLTMLQDVVNRGTGRAARLSGVRGSIGGKTGTTNDYRDAWFVGFSSSVVAGSGSASTSRRRFARAPRARASRSRSGPTSCGAPARRLPATTFRP